MDAHGKGLDMADKPVTVAVATYADKASAEQDYDAVRGIKHQGQIDHLAIAMVVKDDDGELHIDRHDSTAKHLAWGGGVLGGVLTVVSAPLGIVFLAPLAATSAVWAGAGGLVGHFWKNIPKEQVREMGDLLEDGDVGLVIVAVNPKDADLDALLANAVTKVVNDDVSDTSHALERAFDAVDEQLDAPA
jgi:uncharacterized membrane protein